VFCQNDDGSAWKYPLYEVKVKECSGLRRISVLRAIFRCSITNCERLRSVNIDDEIAHLKIVKAEALKKITNMYYVESLTGDYTKENATVD
jgi:hypothetical protein